MVFISDEKNILNFYLIRSIFYLFMIYLLLKMYNFGIPFFKMFASLRCKDVLPFINFIDLPSLVRL